jgi:hypothetical protein
MLTCVSDAEDIDNVASIIALISALEHGEPLRRALAQVGLTMATFQALNNQLCQPRQGRLARRRRRRHRVFCRLLPQGRAAGERE